MALPQPKQLTLAEKRQRATEVLARLGHEQRLLLAHLGCANAKDVSNVAYHLGQNAPPQDFEFLYSKGTPEETCTLWTEGCGVDWATAEYVFQRLLAAAPERVRDSLSKFRELQPGESLPPDEDC